MNRNFRRSAQWRQSSRAARRTGAAFYLDGAVVKAGDSLTVILKLLDAVRDSLLRQESVTALASPTSAAQVALRAVVLILPRLLPPNGRIDLSYIADRSPAAIADWLQGEREYAHSGYQAALEHMNRALKRDSAMGVAARNGAQAAAHLEDYCTARKLVFIALKFDRQLPVRHVLLAHGLQFYLAVRPTPPLRISLQHRRPTRRGANHGCGWASRIIT